MRALSIKIPNVSESLEAKLEAMILGGAFWPDHPIASERKLATEFDVSRTSLRNALASLLERGLLTQIGKRYHATNIMAELLGPGLERIGSNDPRQLLDYWIILFKDAVDLAVKQAQNSDRVSIEKAATYLRQSLLGADTNELLQAFQALNRAVFDGCYNFFLSQTHQALLAVLRPHLVRSFEQLSQDAEAVEAFSGALGGLLSNHFTEAPIYAALVKGLAQPDTRDQMTDVDFDQVDASHLVDVVLRNPLFFEAVYQLRLITERHAAVEAAAQIGTAQKKQLRAHLEYMTAVADSSPSQYSKLDTELHRLIAQSTHNPVFAVVDAALAPVFSRTTNQWLKKHLEMRSDQSTIHLQHTQIVEAIIAQNRDKAQAAMNEHLAYVLRNLRYLREQDQLQELAIARRLLR